MVFSPLVGEELAPFQNAYVYEVAVSQPPEIRVDRLFRVEQWPIFLTLPDPVVRKIPSKVATQYDDTPESVPR
jgi:hypothetical protein